MKRLLSFLKNNFRIIRFIISGGSSAAVNLAVLYFLTEYANRHYLQSEIAGFISGFFVTFFLQKFWTFQNGDVQKMTKQMVFTVLLSFVNFFLNLLILFFFTEIFRLWYLASEIIAIILLAISNYYIYKNFIFR